MSNLKKKGLAIAGAVLLAQLAWVGNAHAILFTLDTINSSVAITDQSGGGFACRITRCGLEAELADGFGGSIELDAGDDWTFDFIQFSSYGTAGLTGRKFDIKANLAFTSPVGIDTSSGGSGRGFFVSGTITGGVLRWTDVPQTHTLVDGTEVLVDFGGGVSILPLDKQVVTTATVKVLGAPASAIPEPGAALLFGAGIGVVALRTRRA